MELSQVPLKIALSLMYLEREKNGDREPSCLKEQAAGTVGILILDPTLTYQRGQTSLPIRIHRACEEW